MIKLTSLAASSSRCYRTFFQPRKFITAWERRLHQLSNGASNTEKSENIGFRTVDLYSDEVLKCTEDVCGNASESEFLDSNTIATFDEEEELTIPEDENVEPIRFSDDDSANDYKYFNISSTRDAAHVAMKMLAKRGLSVTELRNILHEKFSIDIVDEVIEAMKTRGYLNDGLYAESFSRTRFLHFIWGPDLIKQVAALLLKGIPDVEAENATRRVFQDNYNYHNNMLNITNSEDKNNYDYDVEEEMSQSAMDYLFLKASKQWSREKNFSLEIRKVSMIRWLRDRGFSSRVTAAILKRIWSQRFRHN